MKRRSRPIAMGTGVPLPSARPPPESDPPPSPPPPSRPEPHVGDLLRENAQLRDGMRRYKAILDEKRLRSATEPPPSEPPPRHRGRTGAIIAVITAFGAAGGFAAIVKYADALSGKASAEELLRVEQRCEARAAAIESHLAAEAADEKLRDELDLALFCALAGGQPWRGAVCPVDACEPRALTPDGKLVAGQSLCKAREARPPRRTPPGTNR
jgi:hypothetical protein